MKEMKIKQKSEYKDEKVEANFQVRAKQKIRCVEDADDDAPKERYVIELISEDRQEISMEVSAAALNTGAWMQEIPVVRYISDPKKFQQKTSDALCRALSQMPYGGIRTKRTGMMCLNGRWQYILEQGSIGAEGIDENIRAVPFPENSEGKMKKCKAWQFTDPEPEKMEKFIRELYHADSPMYLIFLAAVMAINVYPLAQWGIQTSITFWVGGDSGSGKTELAKHMTGAADWQNADLMVSATVQVKALVRALVASSGRCVIVDDVKKENSQRQRDKSRANVDICVRSIYQQKITEGAGKIKANTEVYGCAVITGEFNESSESQMARMVYVEATKFLCQKQNSDALQYIQDHPQLVSRVLLCYARWLCGYLDDGSKGESVRALYGELRASAREKFQGKNGVRLSDTDAALHLGHALFCEFLKGEEVEKSFKMKLYEKGTVCIAGAMRDTAVQVSGYRLVLGEMLNEILEQAEADGKIRVAEIILLDGDEALEEQFCIQEEPILYIGKMKASLGEEKAAAKIKSKKGILVVQKDWFWEEFQEKLDESVMQNKIPDWFSAKVSLSMLAEEGLIYGRKRTDYGYRCCADYPAVVERERDYYSDEERKWLIWSSTMCIAINLYGSTAYANLRENLRLKDSEEIRTQKYYDWSGRCSDSSGAGPARKKRVHFLSELGVE